MKRTSCGNKDENLGIFYNYLRILYILTKLLHVDVDV